MPRKINRRGQPPGQDVTSGESGLLPGYLFEKVVNIPDQYLTLGTSLPTDLTIGEAGSTGTSDRAAPFDHKHVVYHGDLLGGTLHALATMVTPGFMSAQDKVRLDTLWNSPSGGGGGGIQIAQFVWHESPAGVRNGVNQTFTLAYSPEPSQSLTLFRNGLLLRPGSPYDFLLSGNVITFNSPSIPITQDILRANYQIDYASPSPAVIDHGTLTGLADDDHLQYLTSPRANTWLASKTTSNLTEGSNQYFTNERAQDAVGGILTSSSTVTLTYNDGLNTISAAVIAGGVSHASLANLTTGDPHTQYQLRSERNANSGYAGLTSGGTLSPSRIPAMPLSFLSDVSPGTPTNGQVLTYHTASSQWRSQSPVPLVTDHGTLTGLADDDHSQYQLRSEKNANSGYAGLTSGGLLSPSRIPAMPLSFLSDVSPGTPLNGYVLTYNASSGQWQSQSPTGGGGGGGVTDHGALTGLADDDHPQYLTSPRADTWLSGKTTTNLTEGSNLYYTDERTQDAVGLMVSPSATIRWTYNDSAGKIQAFVSPANLDHGSIGGLTDDDHPQYLTSPRANTWLSGKTTSNLTEGSNLYYTDERVQDAVGLMVSPSSTIKWTYNDGAGKIIAEVSPAGISHASLADLTTGDPHTQYQLESEKNAANGYAGLNASGLLSPARIPAMPLSFLSDVSPSTPTNGQTLVYHAASAQWRNQSPTAVITDHGSLTGLANDDHTQYALLDGTRPFNFDGVKIYDTLNTYNLTIQNSSSQSNDHVLDLSVESPLISLAIKGNTILRAGGDHAGTNTGDVTLAGSPDYITIVGQTITRNKIDLATDVVNDLPLSNLAQASSPSVLLGRGSASSGDFQQITLGSGLTMTGTVLSSSAGASTLAGLTDVSPTSPTNNQVLAYHAASGQWRNQSPTATIDDIISCYIDASPDLIAVGKKAYKVIPYNCSVTGWYVVASSSGTIAWDIKKSTFASYPTTATIISGSSPKLTAQSKNSNISITGWSPLSAGDVIDFHISSNTDITNSGLFLKVRRTS